MCEDYKEMTIEELWETYQIHSKTLFFDKAIGGGVVQWALDEVNMILDEVTKRKEKEPKRDVLEVLKERYGE